MTIREKEQQRTGVKDCTSRVILRIVEASGFNYCMIDHEHGAFGLETIANLAGWFRAIAVSAIVGIHKSFTYLTSPYSIRGPGHTGLGGR